MSIDQHIVGILCSCSSGVPLCTRIGCMRPATHGHAGTGIRKRCDQHTLRYMQPIDPVWYVAERKRMLADSAVSKHPNVRRVKQKVDMSVIESRRADCCMLKCPKNARWVLPGNSHEVYCSTHRPTGTIRAKICCIRGCDAIVFSTYSMVCNDHKQYRPPNHVIEIARVSLQRCVAQFKYNTGYCGRVPTLQ